MTVITTVADLDHHWNIVPLALIIFFSKIIELRVMWKIADSKKQSYFTPRYLAPLK